MLRQSIVIVVVFIVYDIVGTTALFRFQQEVLQRLSPLVTYSSLRDEGVGG